MPQILDANIIAQVLGSIAERRYFLQASSDGGSEFSFHLDSSWVATCVIDSCVSLAFVHLLDQRRTFAVSMIDGLVQLMQTPDGVTAPLNIGHPEEFSILDLARTTIELTGSRSRIVHRPLPEDDPRLRQPDISRANELLEWTPRTRLREGLARTIDYFDRLLAEPGARALIID
jgi:nucleoside-diphosphate-sugar epimerase